MSELGSSNVAAIFAVLGVFLFVLVIIGIVLYVLMAVGLYKIASNRGIENPWLAWIPVANMYLLGKIVKSVSIGGWEVPSIELVLPLAPIALGIISIIPVLGQIIYTLGIIAYAVVFFFVLHKLYSTYRPQQAVLWLVLSIIFSFMISIFIFILRNDTPVTEG